MTIFYDKGKIQLKKEELWDVEGLRWSIIWSCTWICDRDSPMNPNNSQLTWLSHTLFNIFYIYILLLSIQEYLSRPKKVYSQTLLQGMGVFLQTPLDRVFVHWLTSALSSGYCSRPYYLYNYLYFFFQNCFDVNSRKTDRYIFFCL